MSMYVSLSTYSAKHRRLYFFMAGTYLSLIVGKLVLLGIMFSRDDSISDLVAIILSIVHFLTFILAIHSMKNHFTFKTIGLHCICESLDAAGLVLHILDKIDGPNELFKLLGFALFKAVPLGIHLTMLLVHCCRRERKNKLVQQQV